LCLRCTANESGGLTGCQSRDMRLGLSWSTIEAIQCGKGYANGERSEKPGEDETHVSAVNFFILLISHKEERQSMK
jgi:hypothetical protein